MELKELAIAAVIILLVAGVAGYLYISGNTTNSTISIDCNGTLKNGDEINITLKDEYKNPLPDESVDFKILDDSGNAMKAVLVTDASGSASYTLQGMENGNYTVHCTYNGTMYHNPTRNMEKLYIDDGY